MFASEIDVQFQRRRRERRAHLTAGASIVSKLVYMASRLLAIPLSLKILGSERYGLFLAVNSLVFWMVLGDLGLGSGLIPALAACLARGDRADAKRYISTACLAILVIGLVLCSVVILFSHSTWVERLLKVERHRVANDIPGLIVIVGASIAASLVGNVFSSIYSGLQEGYLAAWSSLAATLATLGGLEWMALRGGTLLSFGLLMTVPPILANAATAVYALGWRFPDLRPSFTSWNWDSFLQMARVGLPLFSVGIGDFVILHSANLIVASRFGAAAVPGYAVPYAIFNIVSSISYMIASPYWPAYTEAIAQGDWYWVSATARKVWLRTTALALSGGAGIILAGPLFLRWWAGPSAVPTRAMLCFLAIQSLTVIWTTNTSFLLIGMNRIRARVAIRFLAGLIYIGLLILLLPASGITAVPQASACAFLLEALISALVIRSHLLPKAFAAAGALT